MATTNKSALLLSCLCCHRRYGSLRRQNFRQRKCLLVALFCLLLLLLVLWKPDYFNQYFERKTSDTPYHRLRILTPGELSSFQQKLVLASKECAVGPCFGFSLCPKLLYPNEQNNRGHHHGNKKKFNITELWNFYHVVYGNFPQGKFSKQANENDSGVKTSRWSKSLLLAENKITGKTGFLLKSLRNISSYANYYHANNIVVKAPPIITPMATSPPHTRNIIEKLLTQENLLHRETSADAVFCFSKETNRVLFEAFSREFQDGKENGTNATVMATAFVNAMKTDQEPILLQAFSPAAASYNSLPRAPLSETASLPFFPGYHGSCGLTYAVSNSGLHSLCTAHAQMSFSRRALISLRLLQLADSLLENPSKYFSFFLGDPRPQNFAVNWSNLQVSVVDLTNVFVVDKRQLLSSRARNKRQRGSGELKSGGYNKEIIDEPTIQRGNHNKDSPKGCHENSQEECFEFFPHEICSKQQNDHNHFAICKGLLSPTPLYHISLPGGLLHSPPREIASQLESLLRECSESDQQGNAPNRFFAAKKLARFLREHVNNSGEK